MLPWTTICLLLALAANSSAAPLDRLQASDVVECDDIGKYTSTWFLDNTKDTRRGPLSSTALFYSRGMSSAARALAKELGMVTIWDVWDCRLYNPDDVPSNRMRCIFHDETQRQYLFGNMSLAFAQKARDGASVLHSARYYSNPPLDGIWATIELPELTRHDGAVHWLRKLPMPMRSPAATEAWSLVAQQLVLSEADHEWWVTGIPLEWLQALIPKWSEIFWRRPGHEHRTASTDTKLRRRGDDGEVSGGTACLSGEKLRFFDDLVLW
ncbi:hypothetical protein F5Y14DRAFT_428027 [Nemania sp. NC0429]|nr:hypothetical protein F5Y14DRAFT_428027 [Nemania sp. NC0429]